MPSKMFTTTEEVFFFFFFIVSSNKTTMGFECYAVDMLGKVVTYNTYVVVS